MATALPKYSNNFNLLRLIFAVFVILSHSPELIDGDRKREFLTAIFHTLTLGEFAVDGFFILSGYLIVQSWQNAPSLKTFLKRRVLRIFPGFIVATLVSVFIIGPLGASDHYFDALSYGKLAAGLFLLQPPAVSNIFVGTHYPELNGAMWTISLEFMCYLFVAIAGTLRIIEQKGRWLALAMVLFSGFVLMRSGIKITGIALTPWIFRLGTMFMVGGAFNLYRARIVFRADFAAAAALGLVVCMFSWRLSELAFALLGAYVIFFLAFKRIPTILKFNALPDVSYGVYLYGWPIQKLLLWYRPDLAPLALSLFAVLAALILGTLSWYAIEQPFIKLKRTRTPHVEVPVPV